MRANAVGIVFVGGGQAIAADGGKPAAVLPAVGVAVVGQHIANLIIGNRLAVVCGQQVAPVGVVGVNMPNQNIPFL